MRFHALLPVRDEADIISQSVGRLLSWVDTLYVFDTGSVDDTWEIIQETARGDQRIKLLAKDAVYFSETRLRAWMFHQARQHMREGDWFLRVDADEFHHISPPEFVNRYLRSHETVVYHQYYDFQLTESEVRAWERGEEARSDRERPIEDRRRWFTLSRYSEPRLCRYRQTMRWPPTVSFPFNAGYLARKRLPIRHYPHRDPDQLRVRCTLRAIIIADEENRRNWTHPESHHWSERDWRRFVAADDAPGLEYWSPGTPLPQADFTDHLGPAVKRIIQRAVHAGLLPVADRFRPGFPAGAYPQRIDSEVVNRLQQALGGDGTSGSA